KTLHLSHGMLRLPSGKMSSRTGEVITAEFLIEEIEKLVGEKINGSARLTTSDSARLTTSGSAKPTMNPEEIQRIQEIVAIGAIKYSILRQAIGGDIIFDFEKSISFEGDSGPYLQYSHTRAKSVLEKARTEKIKPSLKIVSSEISEIEPMLSRFPEIIERAYKEFSPHYLVTYLTELARIFNAYYAKVKIVDREDKYSPYRIALTAAFVQVMGNGLWVLGIQAPEKM
ncbi:MAG: DALR anticodon-binding domain-containing protein, partial [Patescibacteria group bacterium]